MIIFPAIDILGGKCVRLLRGDYNNVTVYGSPLKMAQTWVKNGAEFLHFVNLDGARGDGIKTNIIPADNIRTIENLVKEIKIPIQLGGGIRTLDDIKRWLDIGVTRVILGTVCCSNPQLVETAIKKFGAEKIVCGIDARDGKVAIKGWLETEDISPIELGLKMKNIGVKYVVFTDINRDGALTGANIKATEKLAAATGLNVIASGGVSNVKEIEKLYKKQIYGAILGQSLYTNSISLPDALKVARGEKLPKVKIIKEKKAKK